MTHRELRLAVDIATAKGWGVHGDHNEDGSYTLGIVTNLWSNPRRYTYFNNLNEFLCYAGWERTQV